MRRSIRAAAVSLAALTALGICLALWVHQSGQTDQKNRQAEQSAWQEEQSRQSVEQKGQSGQPGQSVEQKGQSGQPGQSVGQKGQGGQPGQSVQQKEQDGQPEGTAAEEAFLIFAGDIYLSPYVLEQYDREGISGVLSDHLLSEMQQGDVVMANEEFPFSERGTQAEDKQFTFRVNPSYVKILQDMGIDAVSLANNHALDYGPDALTDTFKTLDDAGIVYVGAGADQARAGEPYFVQKGQRKFGFLAASRVIPVPEWNIEYRQPGMLCTYDSSLLCQAIRQTKEACDFLTVYVHWGIERENMPQEYQRQLAKEYIDAGADLVIGAHPHVLQGMEYYNGKPIVYSLGNYMFNQEIGSTVLLKVHVAPDSQTSLQVIPAFASGARTREMTGEQAAELYRFLEEISFGVNIEADGSIAKSP